MDSGATASPGAPSGDGAPPERATLLDAESGARMLARLSMPMRTLSSLRTPEMDMELKLAVTKKDYQMSHSPVSMELPESIYGAAMMAVIRSTQSYHNVVHGVTFCVVGGLVLNILTQFYVLICTKLYITAPAVMKVRALYAEYEQQVWSEGTFSGDAWMSFESSDELCQLPLSQPMFFLAVLAIWTATCWVDLLESLRYASLWVGLSCPQRGVDLHRTVVAEEGDEVVLTGADFNTKTVVLALISAPKIMICFLLWWLGSRWLVATTSFQDLLLNAVALAFVTELDELIYHSFMPYDIQAMVQTYKIVQVPGMEVPSDVPDEEKELARFVAFRDRRLAFTIGRIVLTGLVVVGLPIMYMVYLQQVLPGYRWDVHHVCEQRMGEIAASGGG